LPDPVPAPTDINPSPAKHLGKKKSDVFSKISIHPHNVLNKVPERALSLSKRAVSLSKRALSLP